MCKNRTTPNLSADYMSRKNKVNFERIQTVTFSSAISASGNPIKQNGRLHKEKEAAFLPNIPYQVWATDINQPYVTIRKVDGGKPVNISASLASFTHPSQIEVSGQIYIERKINGIYQYLPR